MPQQSDNSNPSRTGTVDLSAAQEAIRALLVALGFDPSEPALSTTPARASEAFVEALTRGYAQDPVEALGRGFPTTASGPVIAAGIPLLFVCPHHLMPARGVAHLGFVPTGRAPGLSRITRMVDVLSRRLVLQEDLTEQLAATLSEGLDAKATIAIVEAQHGCVALEDFAQRDTCFVTRAERGDVALVRSMADQIGARLKSCGTSAF